jgi:hypothetical protein
MRFDEYLEQLHKYREKRSDELAGLSREERTEQMNEEGLKLARELGLTIVSKKRNKVVSKIT